jgi:hypothetical protein
VSTKFFLWGSGAGAGDPLDDDESPIKKARKLIFALGHHSHDGVEYWMSRKFSETLEWAADIQELLGD